MHSQIIKSEAGFAFVEAKRAELERKIYKRNQEELQKKKDIENEKKKTPKIKPRVVEEFSKADKLNYQVEVFNPATKVQEFGKIIRKEKTKPIVSIGLMDSIDNTEKLEKDKPQLHSHINISNNSNINHRNINSSKWKVIDQSDKLNKKTEKITTESNFSTAKFQDEDYNLNQLFTPISSKQQNTKCISSLRNNSVDLKTEKLKENLKLQSEVEINRPTQNLNYQPQNIPTPKLEFISLDYNDKKNKSFEDQNIELKVNREEITQLKSLLDETKMVMENFRNMYNLGNSQNDISKSYKDTNLEKKESGQTFEYSISDKKLSFDNFSSFKNDYSEFTSTELNKEIIKEDDANIMKKEGFYPPENYSLPQSKYNWNEIEKVQNYSNDNFLKNSTNLYVIKEDRFINEPKESNYWNNFAYDKSIKRRYDEEISEYSRSSNSLNEIYKHYNPGYSENSISNENHSPSKNSIDSNDSRHYQREFHHLPYNEKFCNGEGELEKPDYNQNSDNSYSRSQSDDHFLESRSYVRNEKIENYLKYQPVHTFGESSLNFIAISDLKVTNKFQEKDEYVKLEDSDFIEKDRTESLIANPNNPKIIHDEKFEPKRYSESIKNKSIRSKWGMNISKEMKSDKNMDSSNLENLQEINNNDNFERKKWNSSKFIQEESKQITATNSIHNGDFKKLEIYEYSSIPISINESNENIEFNKINSPQNLKYEIPLDRPEELEKKKKLFQNFVKRRESERISKSKELNSPETKVCKKKNIRIIQKPIQISEENYREEKSIFQTESGFEQTFKPLPNLPPKSIDRTPVRNLNKKPTLSPKIRKLSTPEINRITKSKSPIKLSNEYNEKFDESSKKKFSGHSNKKTIANAIKAVCCAGEHLKKERENALTKLLSHESENFIVIFKSQLGRNEFKGIYSFDHTTGKTKKIYGFSHYPESLDENQITDYFQYNTGMRQFLPLTSKKGISFGVDAVALKLIFFKKTIHSN